MFVVNVNMIETPVNPGNEPETLVVFNEFQHLNEFNNLIGEVNTSVGDVRKEEMLLTKFSSSFSLLYS